MSPLTALTGSGVSRRFDKLISSPAVFFLSSLYCKSDEATGQDTVNVYGCIFVTTHYLYFKICCGIFCGSDDSLPVW